MTLRTAFTGAVTIAALAALGAAVATSSATGPGFSARVDNPWYPLEPGTTFTYRGIKDRQPSRDVLTVTHQKTTIDGAPCVVVKDSLYLRGDLGERTTEWFSQDKQGNVWYFGEDTATLDRQGRVISTSGSWRVGVHGAKPGIFMFAHPTVGRSAQQEFFKGQAEDHFQVLSLRATVRVPYASSNEAMLTKEWTPLEPGTIDHKLYVRGVGTVLEQTVKGGSERAALVSVTK
jgi:hypothetical protein